MYASASSRAPWTYSKSRTLGLTASAPQKKSQILGRLLGFKLSTAGLHISIPTKPSHLKAASKDQMGQCKASTSSTLWQPRNLDRCGFTRTKATPMELKRRIGSLAPRLFSRSVLMILYSLLCPCLTQTETSWTSPKTTQPLLKSPKSRASRCNISTLRNQSSSSQTSCNSWKMNWLRPGPSTTKATIGSTLREFVKWKSKCTSGWCFPWSALKQTSANKLWLKMVSLTSWTNKRNSSTSSAATIRISKQLTT